MIYMMIYYANWVKMCGNSLEFFGNDQDMLRFTLSNKYLPCLLFTTLPVNLFNLRFTKFGKFYFLTHDFLK